MSFNFTDFSAAVKDGAAVTPRDTLGLRQWSWADGEIGAAEADALFDINNVGKSTSREWVDFFVEAISDYVVNGQAPRSYVDDANAAWLASRIDQDGRVDTLAELELLVKILEKATNVPQGLKDYALRQIEIVVISGKGPTRGGDISPNRIDDAEVALLRRMLFAQASDESILVSAAEADMLFRLKDATLGKDNAAGWQTLFVQCVGNHLMAHSDYRPLARDEAAQLDAFMDNTKVSIGLFLGRMAKLEVGRAATDLFGRRATDAGVDRRIADARAISPDEQAWLKARIDSDGTLDPLERALLAFIAEESGQ
jgi:hypothetical protein